MKRGIIHTAFREGTKLSKKVWTTSQDPHLFLKATQQNGGGGGGGATGGRGGGGLKK